MPAYLKTRTCKEKETKYAPSRCPVCGELHCFCRPRFFAGQLLTEEDLNRLDHYIVGKSKLHNRYLHGWGVVCGLEVLCHQCGGQVIVRPGYAIDPCGHDIIVSKEDVVPVSDLIQKCRQKQRRQPDCESPYPKNAVDDGCTPGEEPWILSIRYDEKPSRGITALRGSSESSCHSRRSDGDDCSSAYTSGYSQESTPKSKTSYCESPKQTLPQCEPTVICEGYRYEVFRPPRPPMGAGTAIAKDGILDRIEACMKTFSDLSSLLAEGGDPTKVPFSQRQDLCCRIKAFLQDVIMEHPITQYCEDARDLDRVVCPVNMDDKQFKKNMVIFFKVSMEYLISCLCSSLMPPCPEPAEDPRVVLAGIIVSKEDGRILRICNWTTLRKFVTTFPNLQYWLSWLPMGNLRDELEKICCLGEGLSSWLTAIKNITPVSITQQMRFTMPKAEANPKTIAFRDLLVHVLSGKSSEITPESLIKGIKGLKDEKGVPYLKDIERENTSQFLLLNQLVQPLLKPFLPPEAADKMFKFFGQGLKSEEKPVVEADEITKLKLDLEELRKTVKSQQETIDKLSKKKPK